MTSDSAINVIMLMVNPTAHMKKKVATTEVGSASAEISVERQSRMKMKMIMHGHQAAEEDVRAHVAHVLLDEIGVVVDRPDLERREGRGQPRQRRIDAIGDLHGVRARLLAHREGHGIGAVQAGRRGPVLEAIHDLADILEADRRSGGRTQDHVLDLGQRLELALGAQRDRPAITLDLAAGHVEILGRELRRDLAERKAERFQPPRIEVDLDLADLAAVDLDGRHTVDLLEQRFQIVFDLAAGSRRTAGSSQRRKP